VSTRLLVSAASALCLLIASPAVAATTRSGSFAAIAAPQPPSTDPSLADPIWKTGVTATDFIDFTTRKSAPHATTAYVLYDATHLYVGFVCEQRNVPLVATTTVNDSGSSVDDGVTVELDTSGVGKRTYTFGVNPHGVRFESSSESARFRPQWAAIAAPTAQGWNAQLVIPLEVLRGEPGATQSWRINLTRHLSQTNEDYTWAYDPTASSFDDPTFWPLLTNIAVAAHATRPKPHADVYGLASGGTDRKQFQTASGNFSAQNPRTTGLDLSIPFTNTLAFVGTLNPDFSNVEVDQQTIAPQEFRRGLSEYRPFFSQGSATIEPFAQIAVNGPADVPLYTPFIGTFDRGVKIEGSVGSQSIGALEVHGPGFDDTALAYGYGTPNQPFSFGISSIQSHHAEGSDTTTSIGLTRRNLHTGESTFVLDRFETGSFVSDPSLAQNFTVAETFSNQRITAFVDWKDVGPQYAPIEGYTRLADVRGPQALFSYNGVTGGAIKSYSLAAFGERLADRSGSAHEALALAQLSLTFRNLLTIGGGPVTSELRTYDRPYPFYTNPQSFVFNQHSFAIGYRDGTPTPIDFSYGFGPFAIPCSGTAPQAAFCGSSASLSAGFVQTTTTTTSRAFGPFALAAEYDTTRERATFGDADGQILRRLSITRSFGRDTSFALLLRSINGLGGYAQPGTNLAGSLHARFSNGNELYLNFGTPAAYRTLDRTIVKYVFHIGGGSGT